MSVTSAMPGLSKSVRVPARLRVVVFFPQPVCCHWYSSGSVWQRCRTLSVSLSVVKTQDPNTKKFKQMLIYFNLDIQYANKFGEILFIKPQNDT